MMKEDMKVQWNSVNFRYSYLEDAIKEDCVSRREIK